MASAFLERLPRALVPFGFTLLVLAFLLSAWQATLLDAVYNANPGARASAGPGSTLGLDERRAAALDAWVGPLRFVGLGSILAGIFLMFNGVLGALKYNGEAAPRVVAGALAPRGRNAP